jgi:hypothetical protein
MVERNPVVELVETQGALGFDKLNHRNAGGCDESG